MGFIGYNKHFMAATVGAPGNTNDAGLHKHTKVYKQNGDLLPDKCINLGDNLGDVPLITVGNNAFPRHSWLLKAFTDGVRDEKQCFYDVKLRRARVVTENSYGMLKGRWHLIYKEIEVKKHNLKYVVMACIMLRNLCINMNDPSEPRWRLEIEELEVGDKTVMCAPNKQKPNENRLVTSAVTPSELSLNLYLIFIFDEKIYFI